MFEIGDLITLSNNKKYIFLSDLFYLGKRYVYLISEDTVSDFLICFIDSEDLSVVTDGDLVCILSRLFHDKLKGVSYE